MRAAVELPALETKSAVVIKIRPSNFVLRIRLGKSGNDRAGPISPDVHAVGTGSRIHPIINETPCARDVEKLNSRGGLPADGAGRPKVVSRRR